MFFMNLDKTETDLTNEKLVVFKKYLKESMGAYR